MRIILLFLMTVTLGSCAGHETLKAPCGPIADIAGIINIAGIAGSPCTRSPVNMAAL